MRLLDPDDPFTQMGASRPPGLPGGPSAPPRLTFADTVLRNLPLVIVPVILFAAIGLVIGLARAPVYTSEARLNVGGLNLTVETLAGYTNAVQQLAISYARALSASEVLAPVAAKTGLSPVKILQQVSATPVLGSPVINIDARAGDGRQAVRLANATADSLVAYSRALNVSSETSAALLRRYRNDSRLLLLDEAAARKLPRGSPERHLQDVQINVQRLKFQADAGLYDASLAGEATQELVQQLAPASIPASDRSSFLQRVVGGGLLAGLLIGLGLALARGNRVSLRRFPRD